MNYIVFYIQIPAKGQSHGNAKQDTRGSVSF